MANKILTGDGWENRIRYKMGIEEPYLPNAVLQSPDFIGIAEAYVIEKIPRYAEIPINHRLRLEYAVVLECCILVCWSMKARLPIKEAGPHRSHELDVDWEKMQDELSAELSGVIADILEDEFGIVQNNCASRFIVSRPFREWQR